MHRITSPSTDDSLIQQEIVAKGLTAPRVTNEQVEAAIRAEFYFTASDGVFGASGHRPSSERAGTALSLLTFCVLVLDNGFTVVGHSSCASPENFDADIGRKVARQNALNHVWPLLGFRLRDCLAATE